MTKLNKRTATKYKHIYYYYNVKGEPIGVMVVLCKNNKRFSRAFNFKRCGNKLKALIKAIEIRDIALANINDKRLELPNKDYQRLTKNIYLRGRNYYTLVNIWENGERIIKRFSVDGIIFSKEEAIRYLNAKRKEYLSKTKVIKDGSTKTEFDYIYKYFNPYGELLGFKVDLQKGKRICKTFSIRLLGGSNLALEAAIAFRDKHLNLKGLTLN